MQIVDDDGMEYSWQKSYLKTFQSRSKEKNRLNDWARDGNTDRKKKFTFFYYILMSTINIQSFI